MKNYDVLYLGNFDMPNNNAAAHRVVSIGKIFQKLGYNILLIGKSKINNDINKLKTINDLDYINLQYPKNLFDWIKHTISFSIVKKVLRENKKLKYIVLYNYPSLSTKRIIKMCMRKNIKVIGDFTEWYNRPQYFSFRSKLVNLDTEYRMNKISKILSGIIVISDYMYNNLNNPNKIKLPPLVDIYEDKWKSITHNDDNQLKIIFAGNAGQKDRLDLIIETITRLDIDYKLSIYGISKEQFFQMYPKYEINSILKIESRVIFFGLSPHEEVINEIKKSDLYIFIRKSTRQNIAGFPTKFVEATTCGIPVLTTNIGDISNYIKNGVDGLFFDNDQSLVIDSKKLTKEYLRELKKNIDIRRFYYTNYVSSFSHFLDNIE